MSMAHQKLTFDHTAALQILRKVAVLVGVEAEGAELLRLGDHAVFRLKGGLVARVGRGPERLPSVQQEVAIAQWLTTQGFPSAGLATGAEQPIVLDGHPVTIWEGVGDGDTYATTAEMGALLRSLHDLPAPEITLPTLRPFDRVADRLSRAAIPDATRDFLAALAARLKAEYEALAFALPAGHVHGDFNVGNVIQDASGQPKVIDLDGFVNGPREWDLVQTAMYFDSFGWHTEQEYTGFAEGYGFDVREWDGYSTLRNIRELLMVTWLSQNASTSQQAAEEVERRVETIRSGASRRTWAPF